MRLMMCPFCEPTHPCKRCLEKVKAMNDQPASEDFDRGHTNVMAVPIHGPEVESAEHRERREGMRDHDFRKELGHLINRYSRENGSNTPDFILAQYLFNCLCVFDAAVMQRSAWYGPSREKGSQCQPSQPASKG